MSQDRELENYLQGNSDLSQVYADAPPVEPLEHLDAAILAQAHRAVNARPGIRPKRRWAIPLGMVASLFAIVMIGLQLPYLLKEPMLLQAPPEANVTAAMDQAEAEQVSRAAAERGKLQAVAKPKSEITRNEPAKSAMEAYAPPAAPMAAAPAPAMAAKRIELRESAELPNAGALEKEQKAADVGTGDVSDALARRVPAAAVLVAPQTAQTAPALKNDEAIKEDLPPEVWLARIKKLKQEGKQEEAMKELAAFRKRHPDFRVPAAFDTP